jgi:hypothetical protein
MSHLFYVAFDTPVFKAMTNVQVKAVTLGKFELDVPLAAGVVSESSRLLSFEPEKHLAKSICVVSFTGCDIEVLCESGLIEKMAPVIPLSKVGIGASRQLTSYEEGTISSLSVNATDVKLHHEQSMHLIESKMSEIVFLADCVFGFSKMIAQTSSIQDSSIFKKVAD